MNSYVVIVRCKQLYTDDELLRTLNVVMEGYEFQATTVKRIKGLGEHLETRHSANPNGDIK